MQLRQPTRRGLFQAFALLLICFLAPASAWSQIYKWVNENGGIVYSNIRPEDTGKLRNFEVAIKEEKASPAAAAAAQQAAQSAWAASVAQQAAAQDAWAASVAQQAALAAREDSLRRDQALQDRIAYLEREVQAQQYAPPPAPPPDPGYYADSYYAAALPGYVYPWGYAITYVVPSRIVAPRFGIAPRFGGRRVGESRFGPPRLGSPVHVSPVFGSIHGGLTGRGRR